ncbi:hypothetical protein L3Y34_018371 [Caenorhabditis briggsae]|uniref:C2H2-type domain-containing protein n=1 Tax=Caenorhabditis briggsae TaxID=6238 RepID=A0AAE9IV37_CAEBR|nr:hypothetical protein L3Y34_018371 [Caenorhabditis briggsae]
MEKINTRKINDLVVAIKLIVKIDPITVKPETTSEDQDRQLSILTDSSHTRFNRRTGSHTTADSPPPELDSMIKTSGSDRALQKYKTGIQGSFSLLAESFNHLPEQSRSGSEISYNGRRSTIRKPPQPSKSQPLRRFAIPVSQEFTTASPQNERNPSPSASFMSFLSNSCQMTPTQKRKTKSVGPKAKKSKTEDIDTLSQSLMNQMKATNPKDELLLQQLFCQTTDSPVSNSTKKASRHHVPYTASFCDICKKEVCNKYFLRTHMFKMHGIVIDENKTVIAKIDTRMNEGELTFRCEDCKQTFRARDALREHRYEVHGLKLAPPPSDSLGETSDDSSGSPSPPIEESDDFANILSIISEAVEKSTETSEEKTTDFTKASESVSEESEKVENEVECTHCSEKFAPAMMGFHVMQEHMGAIGDNIDIVLSMLNQAGTAPREPSPIGSEEPLKSSEVVKKNLKTTRIHKRRQKCTECSYRTRSDKNLLMHMIRHEKMNTAGEAEAINAEAILNFTQMLAGEQAETSTTSEALNVDSEVLQKLMMEELEKQASALLKNQNHTDTSGSVSPAEVALDRNHEETQLLTQKILVRCSDESGQLPAEFLLKLPVRTLLTETRKIEFELIPTAD